MTDTLQTQAVNVATAKDLLKYYWSKDVPAYLHGPPGVAKSSACRQVAKEAEVGFIDLRLGSLMPEDLNGIPVPDLKEKLAIWLRAEFWPEPERDGAKGIILFDEMSDAPRSIQSAAYKIVLDRLHLPNGWYPCAAGNRRFDKAAAQPISTALANRFGHIHVKADASEWYEWGINNEIDPMVLGFIKQFPQHIHSMEGADLLAFPSPRSWEMVSKIADAPANLRQRLVAGLVGEGVALEFNNYYKVVELPSFEEIVKNPKSCFIPDNPSSKYALASMISRYVDRENFSKVMVYMLRPEFGREFSVCVVLTATKRDPGLVETKAYRDWGLANRDIVL